MSGCARLVFSDFEGTIFFKEGITITALQESGMWMALGEELAAPLENKATVTAGTLAVYELPPGMITMFADRKISTTVETDLGREVTARMLIDSLGSNHSTCILKIKGPTWTGYVFLTGGMVTGASFVSEKERHYGDTAIKAIVKETGKAVAAIYFLEGGATYVEITPSVQVSEPQAIDKQTGLPAPAEAKEVKQADKIPEKVKEPVTEKPPVEIMRPPVAEPAPVEKVVVMPETPPVQPQPRLAVNAQIELRIETAEHVDLVHPSKQRVMEALEERNIAWVDESTFDSLGVREDGRVIIVLPDGRSNVITLTKVDVYPGKENVIILPKKLLRRWAVSPGNTVYIQA